MEEMLSIEELVNALKKLNPSATIELYPEDYNTILSDVPADKLKLPDLFYYNEKNGITNKHKTNSGMYISLIVKKMSWKMKMIKIIFG